MAQEDTEQDKSEAATPFKLEEARKRGQVVKSLELNSLVALSVVLVSVLAFGSWAVDRGLRLSSRLFNEVGHSGLHQGYLLRLFEWMGESTIELLAPLVLLVLASGVLANMIQTGPVFSFFPLKPDFTRLNPAQGFKRLFSMRSVYEAGKSLVKLLVLGTIVYLTIRESLPALMSLLEYPPRAYPEFLIRHGAFLLFVLLLGQVAVMLVDLSFTRWEYMKKMRMSRREFREELKRREGDAQVRAKRRELQRALRKKSASVSKVKDADVLVTNPTHLAIALQYRRGEMPAPKVISKGAGESALRMRELAFRHGVPIVEEPVLARLLFRRVELDAFVPEDTYPVVAVVLRRVLDAKARHKGG